MKLVELRNILVRKDGVGRSRACLYYNSLNCVGACMKVKCSCILSYVNVVLTVVSLELCVSCVRRGASRGTTIYYFS